MTPAFSLAHLTVLGLPPPEMIPVAARTGYRTVGLRLIRVTEATPSYPLMDDPAMLRATKAAMAATGVGVLDIEFVKITPELDVRALEPFLAVGAALGARHVITAPYDPDPARLADRLAAIGELGSGYGLTALLEFFPWTVVPDLAAAMRVVEATGRADTGILVDILHLDRSGSTVRQLGAVPPSRLPLVHVCDAPAERPTTTEGLLHQARAERLPPGEGGLDILGVLRHLPPASPIALEVPMARLTRAIGPEAVARRVRAAAARLLMQHAAASPIR